MTPAAAIPKRPVAVESLPPRLVNFRSLLGEAAWFKLPDAVRARLDELETSYLDMATGAQLTGMFEARHRAHPEEFAPLDEAP